VGSTTANNVLENMLVRHVPKHPKSFTYLLDTHPNYLPWQVMLIRCGRMAFAGADTGRLPLMFDALDSGIQAGKRIGDED